MRLSVTRASIPDRLYPAARVFSTCRCLCEAESGQFQQERKKATSASAHLFSLSEQEEELENAILRKQNAPTSDKPWDGDERIKDAVLRMLIDQHKPMRVKGFPRKIQQPTIRAIEDDIDLELQALEDAEDPAEPKRYPYPWEAKYTSPSHHLGLPSVRYGAVKPVSSRKPSKTDRLLNAREAIIDYADTLDSDDPAVKDRYHQNQQGRRPMPGSIAAWTTLVEEKIQEAKQAGLFKNVKGRGKPFVHDINESNPYLDRTEFLMNRIVKKQNAAPPWIEMQQQVDASVNAFRNTLRDSWVRRAVRMITLPGLAHLTPAYIANSAATFRDPEWEARERTYHEASLKSINDQLRTYNGIAPYITRRAPYVLDLELQECYAESQSLIRITLEQRVRDFKNGVLSPSSDRGSKKKRRNRYGLLEDEMQIQTESLGIWQALKRLFV